MSETDLEALVRHLAGRDAPTSAGPDWLDRRLDNPASAESRFFAEIRQKTRSLLGDPSAAAPDDADRGPDPGDDPTRHARAATAGPGRSSRGRPALVVGGVVALLALGWAIGVRTTRGIDDRAHERTTQLLGEIRLMVGRLQPGPPPDPAAVPGRVEPDLASLASELDAIRRSLEARPPGGAAERPVVPNLRPPESAPVPSPPPAIAAELAAIRRELASSEVATTRQIQDMKSVVHELNGVVRRILARPQPTPSPMVSSALLAVTIQALIHNLQHASAQVRGEAAEQLVRIGAPARSSIPALQQRLPQESDQNVRTAIETALSVLSAN